MAGVADHEPLLVVRDWPTPVVPETSGTAVFFGAVVMALNAELATPLLPVTFTRSCLPASPGCRVYVDAVALATSAQVMVVTLVTVLLSRLAT